MASDVTFDKNNSGVQMGNNYGSADIHIHKGLLELRRPQWLNMNAV